MQFIETLLEELEKITPAQIELAMSGLKPLEEGETVVCAIQSDRAKRLWALAHQYDGKGLLIAHQMHFSATKEERAALHVQMHKLHAIENAARELAWLEIRYAVGDEFANWDGEIGLREGFTLVLAAPSSGPLDIGEMIGGIKISGDIMGAITDLIRRRRKQQAEEEAAAKEKVQ